MTLAATLAAGGMRPASCLPTIKCSSCGQEIEIAAMGDHLCDAPPSDELDQSYISLASNPFTLRRLDASGPSSGNISLPPQQSERVPQPHARSPTLTAGLNGVSKMSRMALPKINPEAANRPFLAPMPTGLESPLSPGINMRPGKSQYQRSATSPLPRLYDPRPPSPELSANLDCAFPPFPTSATSSRPSTSQGRRTPTGSERAPSRGGSRLDQVLNAEPEPFNMEPKSPMLNAGENVLQRLNTLKSGPFAGARRQGSSDPRDASSRRPSAPGTDFPASPSSLQPVGSQSRRPSTPLVGSAHEEANETSRKSPSPRQARPDEEVLTPSFLDQFSAEPISVVTPPFETLDSGTDRSNTYPPALDHDIQRPDSQTLSKVRSEPALRDAERRPSLAKAAVSGPLPSASHQMHPPRGQSRSAIRMDYRLQDAPPVPRPVIRSQEASLHSPSESGSSAASATQSSTHTESTHTSHEPSPGSSSASSVDAFSPLGSDARKQGGETDMRIPGLNVRNQQKPGERAELPKQSSPPRALTRGTPSNATPAKTNNSSISLALDSPMDPAMQPRSGPSSEWATFEQTQSNQAQQLPPRTSSRTPTQPPNGRVPLPPTLAIPQHSQQSLGTGRLGLSPTERSQSPGNSSTQYTSPSIASSHDPSQIPLQSPPTPQQPQARKNPGRRPTMSSKPKCRGCGLVIEGKSVKAADGRLTGRWHKACFTCRSCKQPFTTADFYVINNEPYCEHDYHEQNGSLCQGCNRGIEGQYLETTSTTRFGRDDKKFHPRCFTCWECRIVLSEDYFEITGKVFCERHALAAMRAQARMGGPGLVPPGRRDIFAERRTTRLIDPMMP